MSESGAFVQKTFSDLAGDLNQRLHQRGVSIFITVLPNSHSCIVVPFPQAFGFTKVELSTIQILYYVLSTTGLPTQACTWGCPTTRPCSAVTSSSTSSWPEPWSCPPTSSCGPPWTVPAGGGLCASAWWWVASPAWALCSCKTVSTVYTTLCLL